MELDYENGQVLDFVQALLGSISQNMRVVSLIPQERAAILLFLLEEESEIDGEEINDIVFEYFALRPNGRDGKSEASVRIIGSRELTSEDLIGRVVYI